MFAHFDVDPIWLQRAAHDRSGEPVLHDLVAQFRRNVLNKASELAR
jgi:hypothetical protein